MRWHYYYYWPAARQINTMHTHTQDWWNRKRIISQAKKMQIFVRLRYGYDHLQEKRRNSSMVLFIMRKFQWRKTSRILAYNFTVRLVHNKIILDLRLINFCCFGSKQNKTKKMIYRSKNQIKESKRIEHLFVCFPPINIS